MPQRPRSHKIEGLSRNKLHEVFGRLGWVVWDLQPDYGEDLLVRIFIKDKATPYSFFIQAKSTDHIENYMHKDGKHLSYPIDVDHIQYWNQFWEPVILTVWDANSDITYWEVIQDSIERNHLDQSQNKTLHVDIPVNNILDVKGLKNIFERTKLRFNRFKRVSEGINVLVDFLEQHLNVKVEYDLGEEYMAIENSSGEVASIFFGDLANMLITGNMEQFTEFADAFAEDIDVNLKDIGVNVTGENSLIFLLLIILLGAFLINSLDTNVWNTKIAYEEYPEQGRIVIRY